ncbi:MAG: aldehyde dehydrogenase family protein [Acidobacteria bacterium]|nr:aldehyde dehydrogenase family protein [Acidobacteriota bacterium]MCG3190783.1 Aldehyde dehydrogenase, thermostable [Thermoanaerobaculia bacterium]MCK6683557.1 aldehyde dehydrogenase family protein [Thermoanaerobaculia bacterium]
MQAPVFKNFVNGEWVTATSGKLVENRNPADTRDLIGLFQDSSAEDVKAAVDVAAEAYKSWRLVPGPQRGEILYRAGQLLKDRKEKYSAAMTREMGKVLKEARGDVQEAIDISFLMGGEGRRLFGQTTPSELPNKFAMSVRCPVGVCGFITPWNFPMAIPSWKTMAALICGNTVVIKPATDTPHSTLNFAEALHDAGLPPGVFNVVTGSGRRVGMPLIKDPRVKVVSFTGSTDVGRTISEACASDFKHCHLEMGGKNPIIVMDDANVDLAVDGAVWGAFGTTGQRCTASSRLLVHKKVVKEFTQKLAERARALKVGNGLDETVDMGPAINEGQLATVLEYIEIGKNEGATLAAGGVRLTGPEHEHGFFVAPTVFADGHRNMRIAREEIFGAVTVVVPIDSLEEAIDIANDSDYGLSSAIFTQDVNKAFVAMRDLEAGIFYVNLPTIGAETHLPFGGWKQTGNGHREAGSAALDVFSEWKSIYVDYSGRIQKAQIDIPASS